MGNRHESVSMYFSRRPWTVEEFEETGLFYDPDRAMFCDREEGKFLFLYSSIN